MDITRVNFKITEGAVNGQMQSNTCLSTAKYRRWPSVQSRTQGRVLCADFSKLLNQPALLKQPGILCGNIGFLPLLGVWCGNEEFEKALAEIKHDTDHHH